MSKIRKLQSVEKPISDIITNLGIDECIDIISEITGQLKSKSALYKWGDPDTEQNIQLRYAVALDIACIRKGIAPRILEHYKDMLSQETSMIKQERHDLITELLKTNSELGKLNLTVEQAYHPNSEQGKNLSPREINEINDVIVKIEARIKELKLSIC
tara:strand:+ start:748 stop:1221 length:474 start_codon:yes stop_codon:yes gene_type:complete